MKITKHAGFTLVETLVVMIILGFVMVAASGLASTVIRSAGLNQDRVQAIYLTQECSELVRNVRDSSWRQNTEWYQPFATLGLEPAVYDPADPGSLAFTVEPTLIGHSPVSDYQSDLAVKIRPTTIANADLYRGVPGLTHDMGTDNELSQFRRYFTIDGYDPVAQRLEITCHTEWDDDQTSLSQVLTNWRKP